MEGCVTILVLWTIVLIGWSIFNAVMFDRAAKAVKLANEQAALLATFRMASLSPFDNAGSASLSRNDSYFYVGGGKSVSSQHPDWPPNVGDIRDDPRRKM